MNKNSSFKLLDSKSGKYFFSQTAFGTAFTCLTSGVFLSGLALLMGTSDVVVSYISVITNICGVLILVLAPFLERFRSRKKLTVCFTVLSKLATLLIVTIPAFVPAGMQIIFFIAAVIIAFTLQAQTTVALNNWLVVSINEKTRGRYISFRQTLALIVTVSLSVSGGYLLDAMTGKYIGFLALFSVAFFMGIAEIAILLRIPDSTIYTSPGEKRKFYDAVKIPLHNKAFMGFVVYITVFYLILNMADSFTMVYIMKYLKLPYRLVTFMYMLISLPQIVLLGIWGKISDNRGHNFVLKISIWFFAGETLFMAFAGPHSYHIFIPVSFIIASIANSGFVVSVFNRRYELMPGSNRIIFDNFYSAAIGIAFILGPMAGGIIKYALEQSDTVTKMVPYASLRILYIFATLGILLLQIVYLLLQKNTQSLNLMCERETYCVES